MSDSIGRPGEQCPRNAAAPVFRAGADAVHGNDDGVELRVVRKRSRWPYVGYLALGIVAAALVQSLVTNERYEWHVVAEYLFSEPILAGLGLTLELTAISMSIGLAVGTPLGVMRLSRSRLLQLVGGAYIWVFRSVPLLVQLFFWFNIAALYPKLSVGVPFGPSLFAFDANAVISAFVAAIIGLSLHEAAYTAEIVRGGILSVAKAQSDSAHSLGMTTLQVFMRVVLPQAMRTILPPMTNRVITMAKDTSLVSVLALSDLLYSAEVIYARTFAIIPLLLVACIWYLVIVAVLSFAQAHLERHFGKGFAV
jgi:polar amino acid transport system permease protein